jgi:hypothetical protein
MFQQGLPSSPSHIPHSLPASLQARPRPVLLHDTEASHLALHYWHEGIDSAARKSRHLVMPFTSQPPRPPLIAGKRLATSTDLMCVPVPALHVVSLTDSV